MELLSKIAIVTGASKGVGRQISLDLAKKGCIVAMVARSTKLLENALQEVRQFSPNSTAFICDVADHAVVKDVVRKVFKKFGRIDILINNAGIGIYRDFSDSSIDDFKSQMDTNYYGTLYFSKEVSSIMKKNGSGHIINIASVAGKSGYPMASGYCASKHAVVGLTEGMYHDLIPFKVNVSLICPGAIKGTEFFNHPSYENFPHKTRHKHALPVDVVSKAVFKALKTKKFEFIMPLRGKIISIGKNILTERYMDVVSKLDRGLFRENK